MAGNICKLLVMAALLSTTHSQAGNVLFEIGTKDNSAAEFALYPGKYKNFLMDFPESNILQSVIPGRQATGLMYSPVLKTIGVEEDTGPDITHAISRLSIFSWLRRKQKVIVSWLSILPVSVPKSLQSYVWR